MTRAMAAVAVAGAFSAPARAASSFTLSIATSGPIGVSSITSVSSGGISCGAGGFACSSSFGAGSTVTLAMYQPAKSTTVFAGWGGDGCKNNLTTCGVLMDGAKVVTARFNPVLAVSLGGNGAGVVTSSTGSVNCTYSNGCANGSQVTQSFSRGSVVVLRAAAASSSTFAGWSGYGPCSSASTCTVTMDSYHAVVATFTSIGPFAIKVNKGGTGSGTVTSSPAGINCGGVCSSTFSYLASVTFSALASSGSAFVGWANAGCSGTTTCVVLSTSAQQGLGGRYSPSAFFYLR